MIVSATMHINARILHFVEKVTMRAVLATLGILEPDDVLEVERI